MRARAVLTGLIACLALGPAKVSWAQTGNEDFRAETWSGGVLESDVRLGINLAAPGASGFGVVWSGRGFSGPGALFSNPAFLALGKGGIVLDGRLSLGNGSLGMGQSALLSNSVVVDATDDFLADMSYTSADAPSYTRLAGITAGQPSDLAAIVGSFEVRPGLTMAAGYYSPISSRIGFRASGIETILDAGQRSGAQTIDIDVLGQISAASQLDVDMAVLSAGLGVHLGTDDLGSWHAGASVSRRTMHVGLDWDVEPELMIVLSGSQQYFFNHPADPNLAAGQTNVLAWNARARYAGSAWGARAGLRFATPAERLVLSVAGSWAQDLTMNDPAAFAESYLPLFVNLSGSLDPADHEEELLDVEALNLAKPNLTRRSTDSLGTRMIFRQPNSLTFGLDLGLGPHTITANYVLYDGELSAEGVYGSRGGQPKTYRIGKALNYEIRGGLDLRFPDRMTGLGWLLLPIRLVFLDLDGLLFQAMGNASGYSNPHYRIGAGVAFGQPVVTGVERNISGDLETILDGALPTGIAMARSYSLFDRLDVGVTVAGVPDLFFRTSVTYRLR